MLSGPLATLSPAHIAYLGLALFGFLSFAATLAVVASWSDYDRPKSGRPVKQPPAPKAAAAQEAEIKRAA
jgi:predicted membrane metal-binding protein